MVGTDPPATVGTTVPPVVRGTAPAESVTFRPVLQPTTAASPEPGLDQLGPAVLDGNAVVGARVATTTGDGWTVAIELRDDPSGIGAFNAAAAECFLVRPGCPTGQLAIVVDGQVVSAPQIQTGEFEHDAIQISGGGGQAEALALAERLNAAAHG